MFHFLQDFLVAAESPDLHGFAVGPALAHLPPTLATFALAALTNMLVALAKEETGVKEWIRQLPASVQTCATAAWADAPAPAGMSRDHGAADSLCGDRRLMRSFVLL